MYQAIEAISKLGMIQLLEPVQLEENEQLIVLRISKKLLHAETLTPPKDWRQFAGALNVSPTFNADPLTIQETMRNEWD